MEEILALMKRRDELMKIIHEAQTEVAVIDADLARLAPETGFDYDGRHWMMKRPVRHAWDHHALVQEVARRAIESREPDENGVVPDPVAVVLDALERVASFNYWRAGELKKMEIDPTDYRDSTYGKPKPVPMEVTSEA